MGIKLNALGEFVTQPGTGEVRAAPGFGLRLDGSAYYDPAGAQPGEAAWLRLEPTGEFSLQQNAPSLEFGDIGVLLTRGLPENTRLLLVAACDCGEIVSRPGHKCARCSAPTHVELEAGTRRPVDQADPTTGPIREKPGHIDAPPTARTPVPQPGRPVELQEPATLEVREKVGETHQPPAAAAPTARDGQPVQLAEHRTIETTPRTPAREATGPVCRGCGVSIDARGLCAVCQDGKDMRKVSRLAARGDQLHDIARATGLPAPRVQRLLDRAQRGTMR